MTDDREWTLSFLPDEPLTPVRRCKIELPFHHQEPVRVVPKSRLVEVEERQREVLTATDDLLRRLEEWFDGDNPYWVHEIAAARAALAVSSTENEEEQK